MKPEWVMPIEYLILRDKPVPINRCPACGAEPFKPFLRGMVQRSPKPFFGLAFWMKDRPYCALICRKCKDIVGYEK